ERSGFGYCAERSGDANQVRLARFTYGDLHTGLAPIELRPVLPTYCRHRQAAVIEITRNSRRYGFRRFHVIDGAAKPHRLFAKALGGLPSHAGTGISRGARV